jgi:signal transduction histidine kinase
VILTGAAVVIWFGIKPSYEDAIMEERLTLITEYQQQRIREAEIQLFFWLKTTTELQRRSSEQSSDLEQTFNTYTELFPDLLGFYSQNGIDVSLTKSAIASGLPSIDELSTLPAFLVNPHPELKAGWFDNNSKFQITISDTINGVFSKVTTIFDATKMNQIMLQNVLRGNAFTSIWKPDSTVIGNTLDKESFPIIGPTTTYYSQETNSQNFLAAATSFTSLPLIHTIYVDQSYLQSQVSELFSQSLIMLVITFLALAAAGHLLISRVQRPVKDFLNDVGPFANFDFNKPFRSIELPDLSGIAEKMEEIRKRLLHYQKINVEQIILHDHRNRLLMNHAIEMAGQFDDKEELVFINEPLKVLFQSIGISSESVNINDLFKHHQVQIRDKKQDISTRDHLIVTSQVYTIEINYQDESIGYYQVHLNYVNDQNEQSLGGMMLVINQTKDKEVEKMRVEMANMIIHELQNPVNAGLGLTTYLIEEKSISDQERSEILVMVRQSLDSIMQLIDRFLKVSRLESANIRVDKVSTDLNKMLKPICASFKSQLDEKKLDLIVNAESVPVVNANSDMIQDVIKNLISNAIKYGPTSRAIYIALWATQSHVNLSVTDHGYGISDEHMTKIFQKFYRINEYSKEKGTGLGLSYVKEVIKKHDGEVNVESNPDIGSRFTISLPIS